VALQVSTEHSIVITSEYTEKKETIGLKELFLKN